MAILLLLVLILLNGIFAMSEISVVSARKARLQQMADEGNARAAEALRLAESPLTFLAATQIGITLVAIVSGAFGEAAIAENVAALLARVPLLAPYREPLATVVVVALITYLSLVLGELAPKRIGLHSPEKIASLIAPPMNLLAKLTAPVVSFLSFSTNLVLRLIGLRPQDEPDVTEEEIKVLIGQATRAGVFTTAEEELLRRSVELGDLDVEQLMTHRTEVVWLDLEDAPEEHARVLAEHHHSRYPVGRDDLDHIVGVLFARDVLAECIAGKPLDLPALLHPPLLVAPGTKVFRLLERFRRDRTHLAVVVDEYGGTAGIISLDDVLTALLGEIPTAEDAVEPAVRKREDGSYLIDGSLKIDAFLAVFGPTELPDPHEYITVAGLVMHLASRLPKVGDVIEFRDLRFEVVDLDERRIDKLIVRKIEAAPEPEGE